LKKKIRAIKQALFLTPSDEQYDNDASLLLERVGEEPVQVVALAEHPRVVCQAKVLGRHQKQPAINRVLKNNSNQGRDSPIVKYYSSTKNYCLVTCVNSALCNYS
jgi:hypothetical protein